MSEILVEIKTTVKDSNISWLDCPELPIQVKAYESQ